jgi:hypothetical protein
MLNFYNGVEATYPEMKRLAAPAERIGQAISLLWRPQCASKRSSRQRWKLRAG